MIDHPLNKLAAEVHAIAVEKGWYVSERSFGDLIALAHSELSEALEAHRDGHDETYYGENGKPEGVPSEIADSIIRLLDMAAERNIDIGKAVDEKIAFNRTRSFRHGNKIL